MRLLLDTHLAFWALFEQERLSVGALELMLDPANLVSASVVNVWEVAIKHGRGRLPVSGREMHDLLVRAGFPVLPVTAEHAAAIDLLPPIHRDPFDRMLVAQARSEPMRLLTSDDTIARYGDHITLV